MKGIISTVSRDIPSLLAKAQNAPGLVGRDLVREVSCSKPYRWKKGVLEAVSLPVGKSPGNPRVVVLDCGVKYNILRLLESHGCEVIVLPAGATGRQILSCSPDGILFSNGPGDPAALPYIVEAARNVLGKAPVFGICLGHQILAQALGGKTRKLKFGRSGIRRPRLLRTSTTGPPKG
jgi:carbamoyl-phosphate synthase small subunit